MTENTRSAFGRRQVGAEAGQRGLACDNQERHKGRPFVLASLQGFLLKLPYASERVLNAFRQQRYLYL